MRLNRCSSSYTGLSGLKSLQGKFSSDVSVHRDQLDVTAQMICECDNAIPFVVLGERSNKVYCDRGTTFIWYQEWM